LRKEEEFTELEQEVVLLQERGHLQDVIEYVEVTREYWAPFLYPNVLCELGRTEPYVGAEFNEDGVELDIPPFGAITIEENDPIVGVTVIGSACVSPGFVLLHVEPLEWKYPRSGLKMKVDGLWGAHQRIEPWRAGVDEGWPWAGMSSARFHTPPAQKVTIMAGSQLDICQLDIQNMRHDAHYCVRIVRVTVKRPLASMK